MSSPRTTSGFRVDAPASCGQETAGRRFAKTPSSDRRASSPRSGRMLRSIPSHRGPPTAPSRMASQARARSSVPPGSGTPQASTASPPIGACSISKPGSASPRRASRTFSASATISGPIPSPGSTRIFRLMSRPCRACGNGGRASRSGAHSRRRRRGERSLATNGRPARRRRNRKTSGRTMHRHLSGALRARR